MMCKLCSSSCVLGGPVRCLYGNTERDADWALTHAIENERLDVLVHDLDGKILENVRFEVIDHGVTDNARVYVRYGVDLELSIQDGGKTLKVFVKRK